LRKFLLPDAFVLQFKVLLDLFYSRFSLFLYSFYFIFILLLLDVNDIKGGHEIIFDEVILLFLLSLLLVIRERVL